MQKTRIFSVITSFLLASSHVAIATSIGVNFAFDGTGTSYDLGPTDVTGVIAQDNWNNIHAQATPGLIDSQGGGTGATLFVSGGYVGVSSAVSPGTPTANLLHSAADDNGHSIVLSNIPYPTYDVYVYVAGQGSTAGLYTANSVTLQAYNSSDGSTAFVDASSPFGTYIDFVGLSGPTLTITAVGQSPSTITGQYQSPVDGFQVVLTPEPTSLTLFACGAICLAGIAFRRSLRTRRLLPIRSRSCTKMLSNAS
jgi:hypothetical protein